MEQLTSYLHQAICLKPKKEGGRYIFKKWVKVKNGNKIPVNCKKSASPDLQSTYFVNPDKTEVLRYIRLDIDFNKSRDEFKSPDNKLDWHLIQERLKQYPKLFEAIEYVIKSTSGTGFHILFGLAPLPLDERTNGAQISARQLQYNLIQIFNEIGIGADPAALGLKQDFCTYNKKKSLVYHNEILTKRVEKEAKKPNYLKIDGAEVSNKKEPFITNLLKHTENIVEELEINYRLYKDIRVEKSFSKLFLYLMGLYNPKQFDNKSFLIGEKKLIDLNLPYVSAYSMIELKKEEIVKLMDINIRTANIYFKMDRFHSLFHFEETIDNTIRIGCRQSKIVLKQIDRAQKVLAANTSQNRIKLKIIEPFKVQDGERNLAIVNWAIGYKWNGYSEIQTLNKISLRVKLIPNFETSKSCKENQLKCTVHSIFSNRKELFGIGKIILPSWMEDDKLFLKRAAIKISRQDKLSFRLNIEQSNIIVTKACFILRPLTSSRSETPWGFSCGAVQSFPLSITNKEKMSISFKKVQNFSPSELNFQGPTGTLLSFPIKQTNVKINAVTFNQRIGFFYEGKMLLCLVKNRHYKLKNVLPKLKDLLGKTAHLNFISVIHMRKNTKAYQILASQLYSKNINPINSSQICGYKSSKAENLNSYFIKRAKYLGVSLEEYLRGTQQPIHKTEFEEENKIPF
ncbi:hypothetical protein GCL60_09735 [Silvanigrella paludirubra]|uniref:Uncharacterized protein n=1 Tax=Silvanigrella paludirubra TaxID=2499159 RepID=A0A6N6VU93_9BACT|nr:hypothetical protein [Silvanigrella paludirubra]KAB8039126.1 hypothetical protein GCL60_09735 [Silvanigrella paludirubra]